MSLTMPRKFSETRIRILRRLATRNIERDGAETAMEIAVGCGEAHRASDWAVGALREMASGISGPALVKPFGRSMGGVGTWTITEAGRDALYSAETHGA